MLSKDQMIAQLMDACPLFIPRWKDFLYEWQEDIIKLQPLPLTLALGDYVRHFSTLMSKTDAKNHAKFFDIIENLLLEGDDEVQNLIRVGILEAMQNKDITNPLTAEDFEPFLHPATKSFWDDINAFWNRRAVKKMSDA